MYIHIYIINFHIYIHHVYIYTHTHTQIYINIYMYRCTCIAYRYVSMLIYLNISIVMHLAPTRTPSPQCPATLWLQSLPLELGLNKTFVYFEAAVHKSTIMSPPPLTCIAHPGAILLHGYWAENDSHSAPPFVCYTPYIIGNNNIL